MIEIIFGLMKTLHYWIGFKKAIAKLGKITKFWQQLLIKMINNIKEN